MRGSEKGAEPEALRSWKEGQRKAGIEPRYMDLHGVPQQETKEVLFAEQTGQCVYCGRGIDLEERNSRHHIEQFRPQSRYPDKELAHENLFLSCGPQMPQGGPRLTCGNQKYNWFDEDCHVEPAPEAACQRRFSFSSDGRVQGDGSDAATGMIEVLNLNHGELVAERSLLIEELDGDLNAGVPLHELIMSFDGVSPNGARVSFANVAVQYLKKQGAAR